MFTKQIYTISCLFRSEYFLVSREYLRNVTFVQHDRHVMLLYVNSLKLLKINNKIKYM